MSSVLDLDVAELAPAVGRFWRWWRRELRGLAAPLLRERRSRAQRWPVIEVAADGALKTASEASHARGRKAAAVALRLPPERVLRRAIAMPQMGSRDLERLVLMDADRLTPFGDGAAYHHLRVGPGDGGAPRDVQLLSVAKPFADDALAAARAQNRDVRAVWAPDDRGETDLLPLMQSQAEPPRARLRAALWTAAALLVVLNVGAWIWRDVQDTQALELRAQTADALARRVASAAQEDRALSDLLNHASASADRADPVFALAAVARALPPAATLQKLEWRDGQARLSGVKPAELDVAAALRGDPAFFDVSPAASGPASSDRFDLSVRLSQLRRPPG